MSKIKLLDPKANDSNDSLFNALSKNGVILKKDIIDVIQSSGISACDVRVKEIYNEISSISDSDKISQENFDHIISKNFSLFEKIVKKHLIIPDFKTFSNQIKSIYEQTKKNDAGHNADYIPQLARVDSSLYGVSFCSLDGQILNIGDYDEDFCLQSTSKAISYCIALELNGSEKVHQHVGREPSGVKFNELTLNNKNIPHNPLINAGAIMTCSLIKPELDLADRFDYITKIWYELVGQEKVGFDNTVYHSEKGSADRNFALAYFMKEMNAFPEKTDIYKTLDFYFQCCSVQVNSKQFATSVATLANGGVCPRTGVRVFSPETIKNCLSMMYSCGMYNFSGEFSFAVGLPAKSGVSGALMLVIPDLGGFGIFSPKLDDIGNTVRGVEFSKKLVEKFSFHNFDGLIGSNTKKLNPRKSRTESNVDLTFMIISASSHGDVDEIRRLIALGIDVNTGDYDHRTPLHLAASEGHIEAVQLLLDKGASITVKDRWNQTPLDDAKTNKRKDIVELFSKLNTASKTKISS
ncbi:glutaminase A [Rickettsiales bacterium]|nr:glutaminase A [Rickettsiales bacterium]